MFLVIEHLICFVNNEVLMKLSELFAVLPKVQDQQLRSATGLDVDVMQITSDTREVLQGTVFVAIQGTKLDTHTLLPQVCQKQPSAIVVQETSFVPADYQGVVRVVPSTRQALAILSAQYYRNPSRDLFVFGVTGTNGKTSCTYLMEHLFSSLRIPIGVVGTIEHRFAEHIWQTAATTPGPLELQLRLRQMHAAGAKAVAMEVSSHALDQYRVDGVAFNSVLFTNLTQDHLDYHKTMEAYFAAKQRLFTDLIWEGPKPSQVAAVNTDDFWGRRLRVAFPAEIFSYGQKLGADFRYRILDMSFDEIDYEVQTPFGKLNSTVPLCGAHSLANVVGVMAAATSMGVAPVVAAGALRHFKGVPGRLQKVPSNHGVSVFVDYAHSPDALENVLGALLRVKKEASLEGKIRLVFGCGGDRDRLKRPMMAAIAERLADEVIVTSDNPRTEDPEQILNEISKGFVRPQEALMIQDRREAIRVAIQRSKSGDVVLIAGKGHEDYQIIGDEKKFFSDVQVAEEFLK
jgi:UDP-N-acetylmuramoyl-L-alanyl-D-glutamate--2,6-diaminopimelate ligase